MISVIIPTYNRRELLLRAVQSVLGQTEPDLECIIVDDASTDGTAEAVAALVDPRIRYIRMERNAGACAARNRGLELAQGEYTAFQDSDDVWHTDFLEKQRTFLQASGADIAVCAMNRVTMGGSSRFPQINEPVRITLDLLLKENLCSTQCLLGRTEVFRALRFDETMPRLQDWEMMLRAAEQYRVWLQPEALTDVYLQPDSLSSQPRKLHQALATLYRRYHAAINASQRGDALALGWVRSLEKAAQDSGEPLWTEKMALLAPWWVYRHGQAAYIDAAVIHVTGAPAPVIDRAMHLYMDIDRYVPDCGGLYLPKMLLPDLLTHAKNRVSFAGQATLPDDPQGKMIAGGLAALTASYGRRFAWDTLAAAYGAAATARELPALYLMDMPGWARALEGIALPVKDGPVRRIGVYYHTIGCGGVQRAAAALIGVWVQMGYQVKLMTASEPGETDYPLPPQVERTVIPALDPANPAQNRAHVTALQQAAEGCDLLVYHAWADPLVLFDLLAVKSVGCRFLVHTHSAFTLPLMTPEMHDRFRALPQVYALADGVVALSETDAAYWRHTAQRVFTTVNPMTFRPEDTPVNALSGETVLWAGRISAEKRPLDAVAVMKEVIRRVPGARLIMVGSGDEALTAELRRYIEACGLAEKVELAGYQADMSKWYRQADVLLCTSACEGFGLSIAEAMTHGVPCVTWDMPWLTVLSGGGYLSAPQGDTRCMADAVIRLLQDGALRRETSRAARAHAEKRLSIDQQARWRQIFAEVAQPAPERPAPGVEAMMLQMIREHATAVNAADAIRQTSFVPMPRNGPCRTLRKKAATFLQLLLIDGPGAAIRTILEKRGIK